MKQLFSAVLAIVLFTHIAGADEVTYFKGTWAETLAKAKAENKYIFVDCYTDWCGWCKVMDKNTMPDAGVAKMLSNDFVATKIEMEHGEGIKLAMKYHITGFPTFIFFTPQGEFVYMSVGYQKPAEFIDELNNARDKSKQFKAPGFSAKLEVAYPDLYKAAYGESSKKKLPEQKEVVAYLDKQKDLFSEVNWAVMNRFDLNEKYNNHFLDNVKKYEQLYGAPDVSDKINSIITSSARAAAKKKSDADFNKALALVDKYVKKDRRETNIGLRITYYKETKNWKEYMTAFNDYIAAHSYESVDYINSLCWDMYEQCDDQDALAKATEYMGNAVAKEPQYAAMDTYAALLYKTGQLKYAEEWANKAIAQGKEEKADTKGTEELLEKIKKR